MCTCPLSVLYSDNDKINYSTNYNNSNRYKELSCVIGRTFKVFCRTYELSPVIGQNFKVFCRIYELFPVIGHTFKAFYRIFELSRTIGQLNFQGILQNLWIISCNRPNFWSILQNLWIISYNIGQAIKIFCRIYSSQRVSIVIK